jgi:trehalose synthase
MARLEDYREVTPRGTVDLLVRLAERVRDRRVLHITAARFGGGAGGLARLTELLTELGIQTRWEVVGGDPAFFAAERALHAGLAGAELVVTDAMRQRVLDTARLAAQRIQPAADLVMVHDVAPVALIEHRPPGGQWVWRCHGDLSAPQRKAWKFVRQYAARYDAAVFSLPGFAARLPVPQFLVYPGIDPLAERNRELSRVEIARALGGLEVGQDKPLLLQVGPLDSDRDPLGTIAAYRLVKRHHDVRLVLAATGGGEGLGGERLAAEVQEAASKDPDVRVLDLPDEAHLAINALQRAATVVLQKSIRDGIAPTVAEAMWKGKPVVGGSVGGIAAQIVDEVTGYLVSSVAGAAYALRRLLGTPELVARLGAAGREQVRRRFLITRHLSDDLALLAHLAGPIS